MPVRIDVRYRIPDARAEAKRRNFERLGSRGISGVSIVDSYIIDARITPRDAAAAAGALANPLIEEAVVRGYITGVTETSLWTHYSKGKRDFGNFVLPDGLKKNQKLEHPVFTPSTKEEAHDRTLSPHEMVAEGIISQEMIERVEKTALALFRRGTEIAASRGLILVDTKYEFGLASDGTLTLIDEIHTPDSSRYWQLETYEARMEEGKEPEYFDKEFLRLWFKEHSDPYNDAELPEAPEELVAELSRRYIRMYEQITGEKFAEDISAPIKERLERNLSPYRV